MSVMRATFTFFTFIVRSFDMMFLAVAAILFVAVQAEPLPPGVTPAPRALMEARAQPTTTITTCTSSSIQLPAVASGVNTHHVSLLCTGHLCLRK